MKPQLSIKIAASLLTLAVCMGAFGAHALKNSLDAYSIAVYEKAVFYNFIHALGLLLVVSFSTQGLLKNKFVPWVCGLLIFGIIVFSGSLYILAITGLKWLGAITPIGGSAFIAAWILLAVSVEKNGIPA